MWQNEGHYRCQGVGQIHQNKLFKRMREGVFTLSTDGSNESGKKFFPIVVRSVNDSLSVESELLSLPVCEGSATGENIFQLLDAVMVGNDIPWSNCLALGCDNASVMTGIHKGVFAFVKEKNPNCFLAGCTLHLVHLAAEKAADVLPINAAELLVDIYHYFQKSSVRQQGFADIQVLHEIEQLSMLKHSPTRWLGIGRCLDRLIANWVPLKEFFKQEQKNKKTLSSYAKSKVRTIYESLTSPSTRLYILFLRYAVSTLEPFLKANQTEAPLIGDLYANLTRVVRDVLIKFVKPCATANKTVMEVDFESAYNLRGNSDLMIGCPARDFIGNKEKNHLSEERIKEFFTNVKFFYKNIVEYLLKNLPLRDSVLQQLQVTSPKFIAMDGMLHKFERLLVQFPALVGDTEKDKVVDSFAALQSSEMPEADRYDKLWSSIGKQDPELLPACKILIGLLTVPHGSAHCERVFSCIRKTKTDFRPNLSPSTLEALMVIKHVKSPLLDLSKEELKFLKGSCLRALKDC